MFVGCCVILSIAVQGQSDGRYRPSPAIASGSITTRSRGGGGNDGRYNPGGDGRYIGGNDGKYVHVAGKDGPGDAGYRGDLIGGGQYSGKNIGGGKYSGTGGTSGGGSASGSGGRATGVDTRQSVVGSGGSVVGSGGRPSVTTTSQRPTVVTKAAPPEGWQIIRDEKSETADGYHYL